MRGVLLMALLTLSLSGLCACSASPEEQTPGAASESTETHEYDTFSEVNEAFDLPIVEIPTENLIGPTDLQTLMNDKSCMVYDTRTFTEYTEGFVPGAINLALRFVEREQAVIPRDKTVAFIATDEHELLQLYGLLLDLGLDSSNIRMLNGGISAWKDAGFEVEEFVPHVCW
jgi:rhodanese-related sulfurtransferase